MLCPSEDSHETNVERAKDIQNLVDIETKLESPIDLNISTMKTIELNSLEWFNYEKVVKKLKITNTGYTAILNAKSHNETPRLGGGPLLDHYLFTQLHFHWGENEMKGSEHFVDGGSMPMELHAIHYNEKYKNQENALRENDGVVVVVYFFKLQNSDNSNFDEIIKCLPSINSAGSSVRLVPVGIDHFLRPFHRDYFVYWGSISMQHVSYRILWIISREPIGISIKQIAEFRTLNNNSGKPIVSNCRPLIDRGNREVFFICPTGSTYATLLPIPREFLMRSNKKIE